MELNINRDRRIDFSNLHYEWALQTELAQGYGEAVANARRAVEIAKERRDVARAKAFLKAHEEIKSPLDKVNATAQLDEDYLSALRRYQQAVYEKDMAEAAFETINTKKKAMEEILKTHAQEFWSNPVSPAEYTDWRGKKFDEESKEQMRDKANQAAVEAGQRRRTRAI